jgi:phosphatidylinositol glycan class N
MFFTGVLYLMFEDTILGKRSVAPKSSAAVSTVGPRIIVGTQVGLVLLALLVTRSSVSFLQARQGLPFGNQVVGWGVLGKSNPRRVVFESYG